MNKCSIEIVVDGKVKKFDNLSNLYTYLNKNMKKLWAKYFSVDRSAENMPLVRYRLVDPGISAMEEKTSRMTTTTSTIKTEYDGESEVVVERKKLPGGMGVTRAIQQRFTAGKEDVCIKGKYYAPDYNKNKVINDPTVKDKAAETKRFESFNNFKTDTGTYIHNCIEAAIKDEACPVDSRFSAENRSVIWAQAKQFVENLKRIHGKDFEYEIEYPIASKQLSESAKKTLGSSIDSIYGFADLIIRESNGDVHVYDFKTSEALYSSDSSRSQKHGWAVQLYMYAQMLRQWGVKIPDTNLHIVPIHLTFDSVDGKKINKLNGVDFIDPMKSGGVYPSIISMWYDRYKTFSLNKIHSWLPTQAIANTSELDENVTKIINAIFPPGLLNMSIFSVEEGTVPKIEKLKEKVRPLTSGIYFESGFTHYFELDKYIDEEELTDFGTVEYGRIYLTSDKVDPFLEVYHRLLGESKKVNIYNQAKDISNLCEMSTEESLDEYISGLHLKPEGKTWYKCQLLPYIQNGWKVVSNQNLMENGIIILQTMDGQTKRPKYDIVMLTNKNLKTIYNFNKGGVREATSVAGSMFYDDEIDGKNVIKATYGGIMLMKAMAYITSNPEFFKQGMIRTVRCWNMQSCQQEYVGNTMLQRSWSTILRGMYNRGVPKFDEEGNIIRDGRKNTTREKIPMRGLASSFIENGETKYIFMPDTAAMLELGKNILQFAKEGRLSVLNGINPESNTLENIAEAEILALVKKSYGTASAGIDPGTKLTDPDDIAKHYLLQGLLAMKGRYLTWEKDINWYNQQVQAPAMNRSTIVRVLNDTMASYMNSFRRDFVNQARQWRKLLLECYKQFNQKVDTINESKFFADYFVKDKEKYILYSLDEIASKYGEDSAAYKLMELFQRHYEPDGTYSYDARMPLVKGTSIERWYKQSIPDKIVDDLKETWSLIKKPFDDEFTSPDMIVVDGEDIAREDALSNHKAGYYSTNMDFVFLHALQQKVRKKWQNEYEHIFVAERNMVSFMNAFEGGGAWAKSTDESKLTNTQKFVDDYIKTKFEGRSLVDTSLRRWMGLLNQLTGFASGLQLWFNTRALVREMQTSLALAVTRTLAKEYPDITISDYNEAIQRIIGSEDKLDLDGLLYQQNSYFGMANMDVTGLAEAMKTGRWNFMNLTSRAPYITSSLPDLYFRNAILMAKMIHDGVDKAYFIDPDGTYRYHFDKDSRFDILKTKGKNLSKEQYDNYLKAIVKYNEIVDDLNTRRELYKDENGVLPDSLKHLKPGDEVVPLWDAYTEAETQGARNYSDKLYGHYNSENEMMLKESFLGHYILQYRTFFSARFEQNFQGSYATNVTHYRYHVDETTGEQIYKVMQDDGTFVLKPASEVTQEEKESGKALVFAENMGISQQGQAHNLFQMTKTLIHFNDNPEEFRNYWANPMHRQLLTLFLIDNFLTAFLMLLMNLFFKNKPNPKFQPIKDDVWWRRWSYGVVAGSLQDGPIWNLIGQVDSLDPPVISQLSKWHRDITSVISGRDNIAHAIVDNIGLTREFSSYFDLDLNLE